MTRDNNTAGAISLQEAAERLGVHYMTAYRYVRTGRLPATRDGAQWLVDPADLQHVARPAAAGRTERGRNRTDRSGVLLARMVAGDEAGTWGVIEQALTSGMDPAEVYVDLLVPALRAVGDGWAGGTVSIAEEHRASAIAQRVVGRLGPRFARRGRKRGTVVLGAPAGDQHSLPCALVADLLRGVGFEVLDIGANAPVESFVETAEHASRLVAVAIAATTPHRDSAVRNTVRALHHAGIHAPVLVGGAAITDANHARQLGADGWTGPDAAAAVTAIEQALGSARRTVKP